jgi:transposase-like protein
MAVADVDEGRKPGLTTDERVELVRLRREKRLFELEIEILRRASAYFARDNIPQNDVRLRRQALH